MSILKICSEYINTKNYNILYNEIDQLLINIFSKPLWNGENYSLQRIFWRDFEQKAIHLPIMESVGVYIWGAGNKILGMDDQKLIYVGMTAKDSFKERFKNRYIGISKNKTEWEKQCNLALKIKQDDAAHLEAEELCFKYFSHRQKPKNLKRRIIGSLKFLNEGTENIWFVLLPIDDKGLIKKFEEITISVCHDWNLRNHKEPLINSKITKIDKAQYF
jgi:hypothetical protein